MTFFSGLGERLNHIFSKLTKRGKLTELEIKQAMREVRIALLEADVNYVVAKDFINTVTEKAIGEDILQSLTPGQQVIKIVKDELINLLGGVHSKINISSKPPTVIMLSGLQGAGKTTMCGKLGMLLKKQNKKPLLVACDVYRPAAINQLKIVGKNAGIDVFEKGNISPVKIAKESVSYAEKMGYDIIILDTAGRLHINDELMDELLAIKKEVKPTEILLTVDAMIGQDAVNTAKVFNEKLDITGIILTKLDGDTRGGAALSIKSVTGKPIKFSGIGEKLSDIEPFYPDRMASRILGMGDVLTLIEKAESVVNADEAKRIEERFRKNAFTLDDFLMQFEQMNKIGNINDIISMIPGASQQLKGANIDESKIKRFKAIIQSMTRSERTNPELIKNSHKQRIVKGSGTTIQDVNQLLKQYDQTKMLVKNMNNEKMMKMFGGKKFI